MLIDQENSNVFAFLRELLKGIFYNRVIRFGIHDQEILLRVRCRGDVLVRVHLVPQCRYHPFQKMLTPTPANNKPVTESYQKILAIS